MKRLQEVLAGQEENYIFPFFWQHGEEEAVLREYMGAIYDCGIRAVCVECRPHPDFLGPKWWQDLDIILDEAKKRGMKIWILDDAHFPTGYANGAMKDEPDEKWKQFLYHKTVTVFGPAKEVIIDAASQARYSKPLMRGQSFLMGISPETRTFQDETLVSVVLAKAVKDGIDGTTVRDVTDRVTDGKLILDIPAGTWRIFVLYKTRNGGGSPGYINVISKPSVKVLLDTVYEPHYERYKEEFGKTIEGFFSDEPQLGNIPGFDDDNRLGKDMPLPWSDELEEKLKKAYGPDYGKDLSLLFASDRTGPLSSAARFIYMDQMTALVAEDFSLQLGDWCASHGVRYIGHLVEDNGQHARLGSSLGHFFRGLQGQHMAGIDDIGNQVLAGGEDANRKPLFGGNGFTMDADFFHFALGKLGTSHAALDPRKKGDTMCEIFGAYGWSEGTRLMKYLTDHFLVRGVNHFVPHAFSPKEFPDPDCPPHFYAHGLNPLYQGFGDLMHYMNRSCHLLSGGHHVAKAAVLYHGEAEWTSYEQGMIFSRVPARILTENQIDFDFVWRDALLDKDGFFGTVIDKTLTVNGQVYEVLIIPGSYYITEELAEWLLKAAKQGLRIIFFGERPKELLDTGTGTLELKMLQEKTEEASAKDLASMLEDVREVRVSPAFKDLRYYHYLHESDLYLLTNESAEEVFEGMVSLPGAGLPVIYDAMKNRVYAAETEGQQLKIRLAPYEALFVVFVSEKEKQELLPEMLLRDLQHPKTSVIPGPYQLSFKEALHQKDGFNDIRLMTELKNPGTLKPDFSGWIAYETVVDMEELSLASKDLMQRTELVLEDAREAVELYLNDQYAGRCICPPYRFDVTGLIRSGENRLKLICATTLENAVNALNKSNMDPEAAFMAQLMGSPVIQPFGIQGPVKLSQENL